MSLAHQKYIESQNKRNAASFEVDLRATALLIVDMQEYFFDAQSPLNQFGEMETPGMRDYFLEPGEDGGHSQPAAPS